MTVGKSVGFCVLAAMLVLAGGFAGSNVVALVLKYHPNLGSPLYTDGFVSVYSPWDLVRWYLRWGSAVSELRMGWLVAAFVVLAGGGALVSKRLHRIAVREPRVLDENDGWGTDHDLRKAGLVGGSGYGNLGGLVLGQQPNGKLITYDGKEHMITSGTTGAGKSSTVVVPCGLSWKGSIVVSDPKRELYAIMGEHRSSMGPTFYVDPTDPDSACYNPLEVEVRWGTHFEQGDVKDLVSVLNNSRGLPLKTDAALYYANKGVELLTAIILCIKNDGLQVQLSFGAILRSFGKFHTDVLTKLTASKSEYVRLQGLMFGGQKPEKQAEIMGSMSDMLAVFSDDLIHEKTSKSDFSMGDIFASDKPMSLFVQIRSSEKKRLGPLVSLLENLLVHASLFDERRLRDGRLKKQEVLLICEEFPAQGEKKIIADNLLVLRSYMVTVMIVTQSIKALENVYGKSSTIFGMCKCAIMYASLDEHEQEIIAKNCGTKKVLEEAMRRDRKPGGGYAVSRSAHIVSRRVVDAAGVRGLPDDKQVLLMLGQRKAYLVTKPYWFKHPLFKDLGKDTHGMVDVECHQSPYILDKHQARAQRA